MLPPVSAALNLVLRKSKSRVSQSVNGGVEISPAASRRAPIRLRGLAFCSCPASWTPCTAGVASTSGVVALDQNGRQQVRDGRVPCFVLRGSNKVTVCRPQWQGKKQADFRRPLGFEWGRSAQGAGGYELCPVSLWTWGGCSWGGPVEGALRYPSVHPALIPITHSLSRAAGHAA